jgi:hypothetical protein
MPGNGDWLQLIILLIIFGGGIIRFIAKNLFAAGKPQGQAGEANRPKNPALQFLEKIREQNEAIAARQTRVPTPPPRDPEDAYYGDDDLAGAPALLSSEVSAAPGAKDAGDELKWEAAEVAAEASQRKKRRSGDRIPGTIRNPREEILHPHSIDLQAGVSVPRTSREHVREQEIGIEEELTVHTSTQSNAHRRAGYLHLPAALGVGKMSLRQAIIGQVILGPPKALEKRLGYPRRSF